MKPLLSKLILASSAVSVVLAQSPSGEVYLTFDDGPIDATFGVLDVLKEMDIKATFFLNGFHCYGQGDENEEKAIEALKRTVDDGHVIANHSWNHMLHNCCNEEGECGAVVCNEIAMWNVGAYKSVDEDKELFHFNTNVLRHLLKSHNKGKVMDNDKLDAIVRLPYTNSYRLDDTNSDCACCTTDDVPPWDETLDCSVDKPTLSSALSALVADGLKEDGMDVFGWDLEWGPENWGADDPAGSLTTAEDLAKSVRELAAKDTCTSHSELANVAYCDPASHYGKVNILTHDFLFEDGNRGNGATVNLPKLREFIRLMKSEGFVFKTVDQYTSSRVSLKQEMSSKSGKGSDSLFGKAGKSTKNRKNMRL